MDSTWPRSPAPAPHKGHDNFGWVLALCPARLGPGSSPKVTTGRCPGSEEVLTPFPPVPKQEWHTLSQTQNLVLFFLLSERVFTGYLGLEVRGQSGDLGLEESSLSQRFVLFCGGWWWWWGLFSRQPIVTAPPRLRAAWVAGGPSLRLSHLKEALGQEAGRQGYSSESGRTWGPLEGHLESAQRDQEAVVSECPHQLALRREGHLRGLLWARAPDPHSLPSASSRPPALGRLQQGRSDHTGSQRETVRGTDGEGAEWGGMAPTESGLQLFSKRDRRSSLLLLGRSGGSRYERSSSGFVSSGRSWKGSTEAQMRFWLRGWVRNAGVHPRLSTCLLGSWPK